MGTAVRVRANAAIAIVSSVIAACDSDHTASGTTAFTDSAGIAIATGPRTDYPLSWRMRRIMSLGGSESGPEAFFNIGRAVGGDSLGRIYVLDKGNHRVVVFDSSGTFVTTHGAQGEAPGELQQPEALVVHPDGTVHVFDFGKRGFARFGADGTSLETIPARNYFGDDDIDFDGARIIHTRTSRGGTDAPDSMRLISYEPDAEPEVRAARSIPRGTTVTFAGCPLTVGGLRPYLTPDVSWSQQGDHLLAHATDEYDLTLFVRDTLRLVIRRPIGAITVTGEMAERVAEEEFGAEGFVITYPGGRCDITPSEMVARRGHEQAVSPVHSVRLAPDLSIWVRRRRAEAPDQIDVFASSGEYLGTLPQGSAFPDAFLSPTRYATVERDADGVEHVTIYEIIR